MMTPRLVLFVLTATFALGADILPDTHRPPSWEPGSATGIAGPVSGAIDAKTAGWAVVDVTLAATPVLTTNTAAQNTAAFNTIRGTTPTANKVFYFPAGEYLFNGVSLVSNTQAIRGAGTFLSTIKPTSTPLIGAAVNLVVPNGGSSAYQPIGEIAAADYVTAGLTRGSTSVVVTSSNGVPFVANRIARISLPNDGDVPTTNHGDNFYTRKWYVKVVSVSNVGATWTLGLSHPIPADFGNTTGLPVKVQQPELTHRHTQGIEDLTIDGSNGAGGSIPDGVAIDGGEEIWLKNVRVVNFNNYGVNVKDGSFRPEVRGCFIQGPSPTAGATSHGGLMIGTTSYGLFEDNLTYQNPPGGGFFVQGSPVGNFVSHNAFVEGSNVEGAGGVGVGIVGISGSHFSHPMYNAYEGNVAPNAKTDGFHGSTSHDLYHRNWLMSVRVNNTTGWNTTTGLPIVGHYGTAVGFVEAHKKWTRHYTSSHNIHGTPGFTTLDTSQFVLGDSQISNSTSLSWGTSSLIGTGGATPWFDWDVANKRPYLWTGTIVSSTSTHVVINITGGDLAKLSARVAHIMSLSPLPGYSTASDGAAFGLSFTAAHAGALAGPDGSNNMTFKTSQAKPANGTAVTISPGYGGFFEWDLDVLATARIKRNKRPDGTVISQATQLNDLVSLPDGGDLAPGETAQISYGYPSGKPAWLGAAPWPVWDVDNIGTLSVARLPAGQRFLTWIETGAFGTGGGAPDPLPGGGNATVNTLNVGVLNL
jgi:hypothetical protein